MAATTRRVYFQKTVTYKFALDIPNSAGLSSANALSYATGIGGPLNSNNDIGELLAGSSAMDGSIANGAWAVSASPVATNIEPYYMFTPNYTYAVGDRVSPTANSDKLYTVAQRAGYTTPTTAATEPTWPTAVGGQVNSNGVTFTCIAKF